LQTPDQRDKKLQRRKAREQQLLNGEDEEDDDGEERKSEVKTKKPTKKANQTSGRNSMGKIVMVVEKVENDDQEEDDEHEDGDFRSVGQRRRPVPKKQDVEQSKQKVEGVNKTTVIAGDTVESIDSLRSASLFSLPESIDVENDTEALDADTLSYCLEEILGNGGAPDSHVQHQTTEISKEQQPPIIRPKANTTSSTSATNATAKTSDKEILAPHSLPRFSESEGVHAGASVVSETQSAATGLDFFPARSETQEPSCLLVEDSHPHSHSHSHAHSLPQSSAYSINSSSSSSSASSNNAKKDDSPYKKPAPREAKKKDKAKDKEPSDGTKSAETTPKRTAEKEELVLAAETPTSQIEEERHPDRSSSNSAKRGREVLQDSKTKASTASTPAKKVAATVEPPWPSIPPKSTTKAAIVVHASESESFSLNLAVTEVAESEDSSPASGNSVASKPTPQRNQQNSKPSPSTKQLEWRPRRRSSEDTNAVRNEEIPLRMESVSPPNKKTSPVLKQSKKSSERLTPPSAARSTSPPQQHFKSSSTSPTLSTSSIPATSSLSSRPSTMTSLSAALSTPKPAVVAESCGSLPSTAWLIDLTSEKDLVLSSGREKESRRTKRKRTRWVALSESDSESSSDESKREETERPPIVQTKVEPAAVQETKPRRKDEPVAERRQAEKHGEVQRTNVVSSQLKARSKSKATTDLNAEITSTDRWVMSALEKDDFSSSRPRSGNASEAVSPAVPESSSDFDIHEDVFAVESPAPLPQATARNVQTTPSNTKLVNNPHDTTVRESQTPSAAVSVSKPASVSPILPVAYSASTPSTRTSSTSRSGGVAGSPDPLSKSSDDSAVAKQQATSPKISAATPPDLLFGISTVPDESVADAPTHSSTTASASRYSKAKATSTITKTSEDAHSPVAEKTEKTQLSVFQASTQAYTLPKSKLEESSDSDENGGNSEVEEEENRIKSDKTKAKDDQEEEEDDKDEVEEEDDAGEEHSSAERREEEEKAKDSATRQQEWQETQGVHSLLNSMFSGSASPYELGSVDPLDSISDNDQDDEEGEGEEDGGKNSTKETKGSSEKAKNVGNVKKEGGSEEQDASSEHSASGSSDNDEKKTTRPKKKKSRRDTPKPKNSRNLEFSEPEQQRDNDHSLHFSGFILQNSNTQGTSSMGRGLKTSPRKPAVIIKSSIAAGGIGGAGSSSNSGLRPRRLFASQEEKEKYEAEEREKERKRKRKQRDEGSAFVDGSDEDADEDEEDEADEEGEEEMEGRSVKEVVLRARPSVKRKSFYESLREEFEDAEAKEEGIDEDDDFGTKTPVFNFLIIIIRLE
jgi:hypothetical protein